jgi:hypothetical protein
MKKVLTLIFLFTYVWTIQAQSFVFVKDGVELPNNAAIEVSDVETRPLLEIKSGLELINKTGQILDIIVSQTVLVPPTGEGALLSLCFFECRTTNNDISIPGELPVNNTNEIESFVAEFYPKRDFYETVIVKYEVVNANNPSDKRAVTVTYKYTDGTDIKTPSSNSAWRIYPNENQIIFDPQSIDNENLQATVYDITGQEKATQSIAGNQPVVLATALRKGVYIVTLMDKGAIVGVQKCIIP